MDTKCKDVYCRDCGAEIIDLKAPCPKCGSVHKKVAAHIKTSIGINFHLDRIRCKNKDFPKKEAWDLIDRDEIRGDDGSTIVHKYRDINRVDDKYVEVITDKKTGKIIHSCKEPLSKHIGHGRAKFKK